MSKSALTRVERFQTQTPAASEELGSSTFDKLSRRRDKDPASDRTRDPMLTDHIAANAGELSLIRRRYRQNIHERVSYEWVRGRLIAAGRSIEIREHDIINEMKNHFSARLPAPLGNEKITVFVKIYQTVAKDLDPEQIRICGHSDCANGIDNGPVDYGRLEIFAKQELLERCKRHFSAAEIKELSRFIENQRDGDGVMTLRVRTLYTIEECLSG
jgi:hypothetical protein